MTESELLLEVGSILNFDPTDTNASAAQKNRVVRAINQAKDIVVNRLKMLNLKTSTFATVDGTFLYTPFSDLDQMLSVRDTTGDCKLKRISAWEFYNHYPDPTSEGYPTLYVDQLGSDAAGIKYVGLYPVPSTALTMYCIYRGIVPNITGIVDYTTGTVTATNASATIVGVGTTFTALMVGRYFKVNNHSRWYKIKTYTNATTIVLESAYLDATLAGASYTISEKFLVDSQNELSDTIIAIKAKQLISQTDRQYVDLTLALNKEYEALISDYNNALVSHIDDIAMIRPEGSGVISPAQIQGNLKEYDIYQ